MPEDARFVPLDAPPDVLPALITRIEATTEGIAHGGVNTVRRPVDGDVETIRYLELDDEVTLRTPAPEAAAARYETYVGRPQRLVRFVPGDETAFVSYAVAVRDVAALPAATVDVLGARIEFRPS
ncbi:hypothetical protein [Actinophytocola sp. NPDC049390]|uniref:hypothetical protein n=1 Tax=Actinophytocola sp. NPDC049390 TaxID=3363894 RepID=UPI00379D6813